MMRSESDAIAGLDQVSADSMRWHDDLSNTHQLLSFLCSECQLLLTFRSQQFQIHRQQLLAVCCRLRRPAATLRDWHPSICAGNCIYPRSLMLFGHQ